MRLTRTGKPDNFYYYVIEDYKREFFSNSY